MNEPGKVGWGFFRRPVLLGPVVGFLAFMVFEAIQSPVSEAGSGSADWLIALPLLVFIATLFGAIPYLMGAFLLLAVCRALPAWLVRYAALRLLLGGMIGALLARPFAHVLNWIPSATAEPRFDLGSVIFGCAVAGIYCAVFLAGTTQRSSDS